MEKKKYTPVPKKLLLITIRVTEDYRTAKIPFVALIEEN